MRVLVTGSTGHVGTAVAERLTLDGHEVVGLARREPAAGVVPVLEVDIGRPGVAEALAERHPPCQAIVHAAAAIAPGLTDPSISLTNCLGTQQMLALAQRWRVENFVFLSGVSVIGHPLRLPIDEAHPARPASAYLAAKLYGEHLVTLAGGPSMSASVLRLTAPIGRSMSPARILSVFVRRAVTGRPLEVAGQGTRVQDYVDVRDVAQAVVATLESRPSTTLNIASGHSISNLELARCCVEVLGSASVVATTGVPDPEEGDRWEVSIARAEATIGYSPRYSLKESILELAASLGSSANVR